MIRRVMMWLSFSTDARGVSDVKLMRFHAAEKFLSERNPGARFVALLVLCDCTRALHSKIGRKKIQGECHTCEF